MSGEFFGPVGAGLRKLDFLMDPIPSWSLTLAELQEALRSVEPAALLVSDRLLRRVIKSDRQIEGFGFLVPHRKCYAISRERLLEIVDRIDLGIDDDAPLADTVLLLTRPDPDKLLSMTRSRALYKYWRLLFHLGVHRELEARIHEGRLNLAIARERIARLGDSAFEEARAVLRGDRFLLPPVDALSTYVEFVAVYTELRRYAHELLPDTFPTLPAHDQVDEIVALDVDVDRVFNATRLPGAPTAEELALEQKPAEPDRAMESMPHPRKQSERQYCRLMKWADMARGRGNVVRSGLLRTRAALVTGPRAARESRNQAREEIETLVRRLKGALGFTSDEETAWCEALARLLHPAVRAVWSPEARFLYDLQRVCVDHEKGVSKLDLLGWLGSFGRRPLKRPLPYQREVLIVKHLRLALKRLDVVHLQPSERARMVALVRVAEDRAEVALRDRLRPVLMAGLDEVGLLPENPPEAVARRKLVEELLDTVVERGFITMGDVRDAISRNSLKIRDIAGERNVVELGRGAVDLVHDVVSQGSWVSRARRAGRRVRSVARDVFTDGRFMFWLARLFAVPATWMRDIFRGDQVLQLNRALARLLDGVYRPGEVYLRGPQLLSSGAFGTVTGRFLSRYVALPFGAAYLALEFVQHLLEKVAHLFDREGPVLVSWASVLGIGGLLFALIHYAPFRGMVVRGLKETWRGARWLAGLPGWVRRLPTVRALLESRAYRLFVRYAFKPAIFTGLVALARLSMVGSLDGWAINLVVFLAVNLLLNSRVGRDVDEIATDLAVRGWHRLRIRVLEAIFRAVVDFFHAALEAFERFAYSVDEWLRFRTGERPVVTACKSVLGVAWSLVSYVLRFCITLLIEPQINPIKHFPVVTVSHKIIFPMQFVLAPMLRQSISMSRGMADFLAFVIVTTLPGVFGFLAWELKENWRLYAANRPKNLVPAVVGHKGETMVQLLRAGFHSGAIPKLFARLRRAQRKGHVTGDYIAANKLHEKLNREKLEVRRFVERELIALVEQTPAGAAPRWVVERVELGVTSVHAELSADVPYDGTLCISWEERSGWLIASADRPDWLRNLPEESGRVLEQGLRGLRALSGVDLTREQVMAMLPPHAQCEFADGEMLIYHLDGSREMLDTKSARVVPRESPVDWNQWVAEWSEASRAEPTHDWNGEPPAESAQPANAAV